MKTLLLLILFNYLLHYNDSFTFTKRILVKKRFMVYQKQEDTKSLVKNSEMIIAVPINEISMQNLNDLKKNLPSKVSTSISSAAKMIESIDSTPFCLLLDHIVGSNHLFIFIENNSNDIYEVFLKWTRSISSDSKSDSPAVKMIIAKRGHIICLNVQI